MQKMIRLSGLTLCALAAAVLSGCSSLEPAGVPVVDRSHYAENTSAPVPGSLRDSGRVHVVAPGDTLYNISMRYGVEPRSLAALNAVTDPTQLRLGQTLRLPEAVREPSTAIASGVRVNRVTGSLTPEERPSTVVRAPEAEKPKTPVIAQTPTQSVEKREAAKPKAVVPGTRLLWPARGPILADFSKNRMGLDIGGKVGDVVVAAAAGTVLFVGDGVKGYGNLVIIKHSPTVVTAYGHNSKVVVKLNDRVKAGQKIAELGETDATEPKLRFEVRERGKPVDPMNYMAPRRQ